MKPQNRKVSKDAKLKMTWFLMGRDQNEFIGLIDNWPSVNRDLSVLIWAITSTFSGSEESGVAYFRILKVSMVDRYPLLPEK